jgi:hypothetical protein
VSDSLRRGNALAFGAYSIDTHSIKARGAQERSGQGGPFARAAMDEKPSIFRQFAQACFEPSIGKRERAIEMTSLKFCRGPHIDDLPLLKRHRWLQVGEVNPLISFGRQSGSLCFLGGDPAEDVTEVDAIKLPHGEIGIFRLLQHQQNRRSANARVIEPKFELALASLMATPNGISNPI